MMREREIVSAIVEVARLDKPYIAVGDPQYQDQLVLVGLVWALTGKRPSQMKLSRRQGIAELLMNQGIPCRLNGDQTIDLDPAWVSG